MKQTENDALETSRDATDVCVPHQFPSSTTLHILPQSYRNKVIFKSLFVQEIDGGAN